MSIYPQQTFRLTFLFAAGKLRVDMNSNHPLAQWIDDRMTDAEFARTAGISKSHLSLILQGKRGVSIDLAVRIEEITEGEFTAARLRREQLARTTEVGASQ